MKGSGGEGGVAVDEVGEWARGGGVDAECHLRGSVCIGLRDAKASLTHAAWKSAMADCAHVLAHGDARAPAASASPQTYCPPVQPPPHPPPHRILTASYPSRVPTRPTISIIPVILFHFALSKLTPFNSHLPT